jgi:hypothetical protein
MTPITTCLISTWPAFPHPKSTPQQWDRRHVRTVGAEATYERLEAEQRAEDAPQDTRGEEVRLGEVLLCIQQDCTATCAVYNASKPAASAHAIQKFPLLRSP